MEAPHLRMVNTERGRGRGSRWGIRSERDRDSDGPVVVIRGVHAKGWRERRQLETTDVCKQRGDDDYERHHKNSCHRVPDNIQQGHEMERNGTPSGTLHGPAPCLSLYDKIEPFVT